MCSGWMFFILPEHMEKKPDAGKMFFIVPESVHGTRGILYLCKIALHSSRTLEKENRRWKDVFHRSIVRSWLKVTLLQT
jgi:hypothetical protein